MKTKEKKPFQKSAVLLLGAEESPILPVIWSLARKNIPIAVGSYKKMATGMLSRYPRQRYVYPNPNTEPSAFAKWILKTIQTGSFDVTMACGEETTWLLSKYKADFTPYTNIPYVDPEIFIKCRDKSLTMKAALSCGVPIPETWFPEEDGIERVAEKASYPAVIKPCISNGARGISYAKSQKELIDLYYETREQYGPCIIQEFIPHTGMQYKAEVLLDKKQNVKLCGMYAKIRYYPPTGGSSTLNRTVLRQDVLDNATKILVALKWWGMGDCDFIVDPRDNIAKLMEINPRLTRTIRILTEAGVDFPYGLYRLAMDKELNEIKDFKKDIYLRYLPGDLAWFIRSSKKWENLLDYLKFFRRNMFYEEWAWHDPFVGFGFWWTLLKDLLKPEERKRRLR